VPLEKEDVRISFAGELDGVAILSVRQFESKAASFIIFGFRYVELFIGSHVFVEVHHVVFGGFHWAIEGKVGEQSFDAEFDHLVILGEQVSKFSR
jgi:hypothetical protein